MSENAEKVNNNEVESSVPVSEQIHQQLSSLQGSEKIIEGTLRLLDSGFFPGVKAVDVAQAQDYLGYILMQTKAAVSQTQKQYAEAKSTERKTKKGAK